MKSSNNTRFLLSLGYWFGAHSLGFLEHPYQSVRRIVRDEFYRPLVFLPMVSLFFWWVFGVILAHYNILSTLRLGFLVTVIDAIYHKQLFLSFIFVWGCGFLLLWQVVLGYLYLRFFRAFK